MVERKDAGPSLYPFYYPKLASTEHEPNSGSLWFMLDYTDVPTSHMECYIRFLL
jgi:hypothetical protein